MRSEERKQQPGRLPGGGDTNSWTVTLYIQSPCPGFRCSVQSSPSLTLQTHPMLPVTLNTWSPFLSLNICSSHLLCLECCSFRFFTQLDYSQSSALNLNVTHPEGLSLSSLLCQSLLSLFLTPCHPPNYWKEQQQYLVLTWGGVAVISILRTSEPKLSLRPKVTQQERKLGLESRLDEATVLNLSHSRFLYML